ncbi:MAG TPA: polysaccharide deacetylase family protein, partial [Polyangiaceae bacterium]|nr:polysaccharide deacetylase family protein [Polyangiaceae bacterium]
MLSVVACSSDPDPNSGTGGSNSTGGTNATGGKASTGGSGSGVSGGPSTGGSGPGVAGGPSGTAGSTPTAGSGGASGGSGPAGGGTGPGTGGKGGSGGSGGSGIGNAGSSSTGGSGPTGSVKCDNLSLAPTMTGVAQPSGAAGGLKVLDWAGFKGAASFTFDDNTPSQLANYTALKGTGGHFTWFLIASSAGSGYKATIADGQEIANHTQTHPGSAGPNEVDKAQTTLKSNFGVDVHSMAAPNCQDAWKQYAAPAKLFQNRGPCGAVAAVGPRDSTDPFLLPAFLPSQGAATSELSGQISAGKWRIYVIHGFDSQNGTYQPVPIASVTGAMSKAVSDGYWVEGMTNVGAYWQGQKLIPASATTSATWTLPANFPP